MIIVIVRTKMLRSEVKELPTTCDCNGRMHLALPILSSGVSALETLLYNLIVYVRQLRATTACSTAHDDG